MSGHKTRGEQRANPRRKSDIPRGFRSKSQYKRVSKQMTRQQIENYLAQKSEESNL